MRGAGVVCGTQGSCRGAIFGTSSAFSRQASIGDSGTHTAATLAFMRIAVVGGHGQVARRLHPVLVRGGHVPVALVRRAGYREELEGLGAEVRQVDIERDDADAFGAAFEGCDAVVFAAGGGPDGNVQRKRTVDLEGSLKSIEGAKEAGIRRFVQVSAMNVDDSPPAGTSEVWRAYVEAKRDADAALRGSGLDWTIIRPGRLTDDPGTGLVALGSDISRGDISRADVATVLAHVLTSDGAIGHQWNLVSGYTPISEAIQRAARTR